MTEQKYDRYEELVEFEIHDGICRIHEYDPTKRWIGGNRITKIDISSKNPVILKEIKPPYGP